MGPGTIPHPVRRTWTVEVRPHPGGPILACPQCGRIPIGAGADATRAAVVAHLAQHARAESLARHLRTCQCGRLDCRWHPRHRGCDGTLLLLLSRDRTGRVWKLADVCRACAAATEHAAEVPEPEAGDDPDLPAGTARPGAPLPRRGSNTAAAERSPAGMPGDAPSVPGTQDAGAYGGDLLEEGLWWADGLAYG